MPIMLALCPFLNSASSILQYRNDINTAMPFLPIFVPILVTNHAFCVGRQNGFDDHEQIDFVSHEQKAPQGVKGALCFINMLYQYRHQKAIDKILELCEKTSYIGL
jgi:hypothetical protein